MLSGENFSQNKHFCRHLKFFQNVTPYQSNTCNITKMKSDNIARIVLLRMTILENDTQLPSTQRYFIGLETLQQTFYQSAI